MDNGEPQPAGQPRKPAFPMAFAGLKQNIAARKHPRTESSRRKGECPGCDAGFFMPLRSAGTIPATNRTTKAYVGTVPALRCTTQRCRAMHRVRDTSVARPFEGEFQPDPQVLRIALMRLSNSSNEVSPLIISPLMKNVGVEFTPSFSLANFWSAAILSSSA